MKKEKNSNKEKSLNTNKLLQIIKKKWLINTSKTVLLITIIIALFIAITILMQKLELIPIDLTKEKLYTLTQESKDKIKDIQDEVNIYFIGYSEDNPILDLARQYSKANSKINVEAVTSTARPDLVEKYGIENGSEGIIIENENKYKVLSSSDLYTYDTATYETINISEEKLTSAIQSVTTDKIPKVYFLSGYTNFRLDSGMYFLNLYLENEINDVNTIDLLTTNKVPQDCDTLVIATPKQDFDDITTNAIIEYINLGGNILWLNAASQESQNYSNVNKILAIYGVNPFNKGIIRETDSSKMISGSPDLILPDIEFSDITSKLNTSEGVIFINATKINLVDENALEELNVKKTELVNSSSNSYYRTNFNISTNSMVEGEEKGPFLVGALLEKTISKTNEESQESHIKSKLVIFGENYFVSDYQLTQSSQYGMIQYRQNKDLVLNSIAYLTDRQEDITIRKTMTAVSYTATEMENRIIFAIIIIIPILIIITGIIVWRYRIRKK